MTAPRGWKPLLRGALLLVALLSASVAGAQEGEEWPTEGTLFEAIRELQTEKIDPEPPAEGVLSIPYTRLDVAVDDGIAITRLLQVFHNHGDESVGYGFSLPLLPDTTISQFNLWDQGRRLVGAIEDRERAEATYKEVTGNEAPSMRRDPGLVRRTENRFDLRIFPIVPGEDKQMELFTHRRLAVEGGQFVLRLPLESLVRSQDPRHPELLSRRVEVSVFVRDTLPIVEWSSRPAKLAEVRREPHRLLLRLDLSPEDLAHSTPRDLEIRYRLDHTTGEPVATTRTFAAADGEAFFSTRVLTAERELQRKPAPEPAPARSGEAEASESFYIGVWRSRREPIAEDPAALRLEMAAFLTAQLLPTRGHLHASWRAPKLEWTAAGWLAGGVTTEEPIALAAGDPAMGSFLEGLETKLARPVPSAKRLLKHLRQAIDQDGCRQAVLFLEPELFEEGWGRLVRLVGSRPEVTFTFITPEPWPQASGLGLPNVQHFAFSGGWQSDRPAPDRRLLQTAPWHELGFAGLDFETLAALWQELDWLRPMLATLRWHGDVELLEPQVFFGGADRGELTEPPEVIWLSGRYRGTGGPVRLEIEMTPEASGFEEVFDRRAAGMAGLRWGVETELDSGSGQAFIASLWARQRAERLAARLRVLRDIGRSGGDDAADGDLRQKVDTVRQEIVDLSRRHSFISSETAFIALPEDLRRQHGIEKQVIDAQQLYNLEGMKTGGLPEPEEWILLALGAALALGFGLRRS